MSVIPLVFCGIACICDLRRREIPDWLVALTLISGIACAAFRWSPIPWSNALLGFGLAFGLVLPFALFDGLGGGDLKFLAALGAWLGPLGTMNVLFWMALAGMLAAIIVKARGAKTLPYAPAIATGVAINAFFPGSVVWLIGTISKALA